MTQAPSDEQQSEENLVWRYTTLAKFLNTLRRSNVSGCGELIAKRADEFDDEYEGTLPSPSERMIRNDTIEFFKNKNLGEYGPEKILAPPERLGLEEYPEWTAENAANNVIESHQRARKLMFLNCWRLDEYESSNMWKAYTSPTDGIVLVSSVDALKEAVLEHTGDHHVRAVSYNNYSTEEVFIDGLLEPFFHKRKQFTDESEVRIVVTDLPVSSPPMGYGADALPDPSNDTIRAIPYDMTELVSEVRVHPWAGSYMTDLVEKTLNKFHLDVPVDNSSLRS